MRKLVAPLQVAQHLLDAVEQGKEIIGSPGLPLVNALMGSSLASGAASYYCNVLAIVIAPLLKLLQIMHRSKMEACLRVARLLSQSSAQICKP